MLWKTVDWLEIPFPIIIFHYMSGFTDNPVTLDPEVLCTSLKTSNTHSGHQDWSSGLQSCFATLEEDCIPYLFLSSHKVVFYFICAELRKDLSRHRMRKGPWEQQLNTMRVEHASSFALEMLCTIRRVTCLNIWL